MEVKISLFNQPHTYWVLIIASLIVGCSGESPGDKSNSTGSNGIECQRVTDESWLDLDSVYAFGGLWSNWENGSDLAGFDNANYFTNTFSNLTAVAYEKNDNQLKAKLVDSLFRWADRDTFVGTKLCYEGRADCTAWLDPAGYDVSDSQSYNYVLLHVENQRIMYSYLSDWAIENEAEKHARIAQWFQYWEETMPQPNDVYFGLGTGFYQWKIQQLRDKKDIEGARSYSRLLIEGLESQINEDGSILYRTTRGDRALSYHHSALNEIMGALRMNSVLGLEDITFDSRIHSAVNLFLRTIEDPSYILPWASESLGNGGDGTAQQFNNPTPNDFSNWYHVSSNGTWYYLYMDEYPDHPNSQELKRLIPLETAASAYQDNHYFPLGCMLF